MQKLLLILSIATFIFSCNKSANKTNKEVMLGDTIQTESGLKYFYLKHGEGRKIEESSKVSIYTDLYINDSDSTFWTTATASDSLFTFYHKKTPLIKGFSELHNYLVEGDKVIAMLPDSIAYGKKGRRGVPPAATLIYNPLIIKYVSTPKVLLSDTLYTITKTLGVESATQFYNKVMTSKEKNAYHSDMDLMVNNFITALGKDSLFVEIETFANYFMAPNRCFRSSSYVSISSCKCCRSTRKL